MKLRGKLATYLSRWRNQPAPISKFDRQTATECTYRGFSYPYLGTPRQLSLSHSKASITPKAISDDLWSAIEPLIPAKTRAEGKPFRRRPGAGRKPIPARKAFEAIVHVLRTGTPWKALPKSFGSASAIHRRFDSWFADGLFWKIWQAGLAEHEEMDGISWQWEGHEEPPFRPTAASATPFAHLIGSNHPSPSYAAVRPRLWQPSLARRRRRSDRET